jgi:integrase
VPDLTDKEFRQTTCNWLRFAGRLRESDSSARSTSAGDRLFLSVHGCGGVTFSKDNRKRPTEHEKVLPAREKEATHQAQDCGVERYFIFFGKKGWTRAGISGRAHHLRMFFRYGEQMRWTKPGIADATRGPRVYQHEQLPLGPSWADVQRLPASTETNRNADIRDRPILLLIAVYGLRVGELQRLGLEDINWEQKTITITATKQDRTARVCPLIPSLAKAIARYIREVRPRTEYHEIFLRWHAPRRPCRHGGLPALCTHLGPISLSGTQRYLTMTPELSERIDLSTRRELAGLH